MFRIIDWVERLCERIYYGPAGDSDHGMIQALDNIDSYFQDRNRKDRLDREIENAEWILKYEKRLVKLQKKTAAQRSKAEHLGINPERLRRLEHHLAEVRRSLD
jgi:hypothetical protein